MLVPFFLSIKKVLEKSFYTYDSRQLLVGALRDFGQKKIPNYDLISQNIRIHDFPLIEDYESAFAFQNSVESEGFFLSKSW